MNSMQSALKGTLSFSGHIATLRPAISTGAGDSILMRWACSIHSIPPAIAARTKTLNLVINISILVALS
jgi:hypothetical protein